MQRQQRSLGLSAFIITAALAVSACKSDGGNSFGSEPLNSQEVLEYDRALNRCIKTGGTRIVKILNQLRCY
jgi:hypothetical protein